MSSKWYKIIFLVLGIATLGYMVYALGPAEIWDSLKKTGWWFLPVLFSWFVIYLMNAFAFRDIIIDKKEKENSIGFGKIFQLTVTGYAINYVTPFVALGGEPYRIMELKPYIGSSRAGSSVLLYSMMHILSHLLFWVLSVGLILWFLPLNTTVTTACLLILGLAFVLCWWFSRVYKKGVTVSTLQFLSKVPFLGAKAKHTLDERRELFDSIDQQVKDLYTNRRSKFFSSLIWEFLARVVGCAEIYFFARALGLEMTYVQALIVSSGSSLFANLIFFFPMQLGTREGGMAMAMVSVGFQASTGVFIGIATRIRELVWIGIGLLLMVLSRKSKNKQQQEIPN